MKAEAVGPEQHFAIQVTTLISRVLSRVYLCKSSDEKMAENMVSSEFQIEEGAKDEEEIAGLENVKEQLSSHPLEESFLATGHEIDMLADEVLISI